jgi:hypothetical protein
MFDPSFLIIALVLIIGFWSTIKLLRVKFNSVAEKVLDSVDSTVTTSAIEHRAELETRMKTALETIQASGGITDFQEEYDKLFHPERVQKSKKSK